MKSLCAVFCLSLLLFACPSLATTHIVQQDGSGDFTTLNAAYEASVDGDIIQVGAGTYFESLYITKSLTIEPTGNRPIVILDGGGSERIMVVEGYVDVTLRHLIFANGRAADAAALLIWNQAQVKVEDCRFQGNYATGSNAVHVRHVGTSAEFLRCSWVNNVAALHSAALSLSFGAHFDVVDCQFIDNTASGVAGAVNCQSGTALFRGNLFLRCSGGGAGALEINGATAEIVQNTFIECAGGYYAVGINSSSTFTQNIVASTPGGYGLMGTSSNHHCNLYFDNDLGPIAGGSLGLNELDTDPFFCDAGQDDYSLCAGSIALGALNGCGDMGAYLVGCDDCGSVATTQTSWDNLKSLIVRDPFRL